MGFGPPDDGLHSSSEKHKLENHDKGIMTLAHFFEQYGAARASMAGVRPAAADAADPTAGRHGHSAQHNAGSHQAACSSMSSIVRQTAIQAPPSLWNTHRSRPVERYRLAERS